MSPTPVYIPQTGSLADRVLGYLRANPLEELTARDVAVKFDVPSSSVKPCLATAEKHGELEYVRNDDLELVYRLPRKDRKVSTTVQPPADVKRETPQPERPALRGPVITAAAVAPLTVDDDVEVVPANKKPGQNKWDPLLAKLTKVGQSIAIPTGWYRPLHADISKRNRRNKGQGPTYMCGFDAQGNPRVKRTA